jgi:hypothetical protein
MKKDAYKEGAPDILDGSDARLESTGRLCWQCRHLHKSGYSCDAFEIIPPAIVNGEVRHTRPMFGQRNHVVFEKK